MKVWIIKRDTRPTNANLRNSSLPEKTLFITLRPINRNIITINTTNGIITNITIEGEYYHRLQRLIYLKDSSFEGNSATFYQNYSEIQMKYLRIKTTIEQINEDMNNVFMESSELQRARLRLGDDSSSEGMEL